MRTLFLAVGGTRRRAVVEESTSVVTEGGTAVVVIDNAAIWHRETFATGVQVVDLDALSSRHGPMRLEQLLLYRAPRFLLYRVLARGRLRARVQRVAKVYERKVADRIHRRIFLPLYRRFWRGTLVGFLERDVLDGPPFDALVVADPQSIPEADRLLRWYQDRRPAAAPTACYSIDHIARDVSPRTSADNRPVT